MVVCLGLGVPVNLKNRFIVEIWIAVDYLGRETSINHQVVMSGREGGREDKGDRERNPEMLTGETITWSWKGRAYSTPG